MEIKEFKPGDYCRFNTEEIPYIIALLKANRWKIWYRQDERYTQRDVIILFNKNNEFVSVVESHIGLETEIRRHDFMVTALRLNEGDGMRSDMSTPEQRRHIMYEFGKLLIGDIAAQKSLSIDVAGRRNIIIEDGILTGSTSDILTHLGYSEWCKRLNVTPIQIPDVGENVFEHTIDNPLGLTWDGVDYRVNKPNVDSGKFVELEYAKSLLNKQILQLPNGKKVEVTNPSEIPDDGVEWLTASLPLDPITYKHIHNKPEEVKVDRMDNYAIQLLQKALNDELKHLVISKEMTQGNGFKFDNATMSAFDESRKIAEDRIPQLKEAIQKLTA